MTQKLKARQRRSCGAIESFLRRWAGDRRGWCVAGVLLLAACSEARREGVSDAAGTGAVRASGGAPASGKGLDGGSTGTPSQGGSSGSSVSGAAGLAPSTGGAGASGDRAAGGGAGVGIGGGSLSERHPGDVGIGSDPAVLFHDDFEAGWGRWDAPKQNTQFLSMEMGTGLARGGTGYLRSAVTTADLQNQQYISSSTRVTFGRRVDRIYWRFYARFPNVAPNPHHWVRMAAGDEAYDASGLANTVPAGDQGFWFDFDANNDDQFNFYVYWYKMRSGRCNDGTATPGCAGDQGTTYYYGNLFQPPEQTPFPRDRWFCIEIYAKANSVGSNDGALGFWLDERPVGDYRPGHPEGTWLRAQFHTGGCEFSACTTPRPFEGFDFRSADDVGFKSVFLDAYYERDSSASKRAVLEGRGLTVSDESTIFYDDVVVATERIGCVR